MNTVLLTGGAGFIGSCMLRTLNDAGYNDIIVVDHIACTEKWKNLRNKSFDRYINRDDFLSLLPNMDNISLVIHMGANSATTEQDFDSLMQTNTNYTRTLWNYCVERQIPFLYASSAATYGDGSEGYSDRTDIRPLLPLNGYGYSKQLFDLWVERQEKRPPQYVGFKFFNVYGPNEYHKGSMASVLFHSYNRLVNGERIKLFKSCRADFADGMQLRDFVYVKDVCSVMLHFIQHPEYSGLYNVGTGHAQSFQELAEAVSAAMGIPTEIEYIDMPEHLRKKYQYYTQADIQKLREAGYSAPFLDLMHGAEDYVQNYLMKDYLVY